MPDDEVVEKDGLKVFVDKQTLETLSGRELDYYAGEEGKALSLQEAFHPAAPAVLQLAVQAVQVAVPADKVFIITLCFQSTGQEG